MYNFRSLYIKFIFQYSLIRPNFVTFKSFDSTEVSLFVMPQKLNRIRGVGARQRGGWGVGVTEKGDIKDK